jgi:hypothetical protein
MGFIDAMDFDDVVEPKAVPEGEYELRIVEVKQDTNKNGEPYILPRFEIVGEVGTKSVGRYMALPIASMDAEKLNKTKLGLKRFFDAMGIDASGGVDLDALVGETVWAMLGLEEDEEYGEQNFVRRFVAKG